MARWTDLATWGGPPADNFGDGDYIPGEASDRMSDHRWLVIHIAEGSYDGTIGWERNPGSDISSHFVISADGRITQMLDTSDYSWCQAAGNAAGLSVECEGHTPNALTDAQLTAIARLLARCHAEYGIPIQVATSPAIRGLGHHSMGADWGHQSCPGPAIIAQKPIIVARAQQIINGGTEVFTAQQETDILRMLQAADNAWFGTSTDATNLTYPAPGGGTGTTVNQLKRRTDLILTAVANVLTEVRASTPVALTDAQVATIAGQITTVVSATLDARVEAAVRRVLGSLDNQPQSGTVR